MGEVKPVEAVKSSSSQFNVHSEQFAQLNTACIAKKKKGERP